MAAQKYKIKLLLTTLKDFWSSANLNLKKKFVKTLTFLGLYNILKMHEREFLGVTFVCK